MTTTQKNKNIKGMILFMQARLNELQKELKRKRKKGYGNTSRKRRMETK